MSTRAPRALAGRPGRAYADVTPIKSMQWKEPPVPNEGDKAPTFSTVDGAGEKVKLSGFKGKKLVLYFYPKDDTPG